MRQERARKEFHKSFDIYYEEWKIFNLEIKKEAVDAQHEKSSKETLVLLMGKLHRISNYDDDVLKDIYEAKFLLNKLLFTSFVYLQYSLKERVLEYRKLYEAEKIRQIFPEYFDSHVSQMSIIKNTIDDALNDEIKLNVFEDVPGNRMNFDFMRSSIDFYKKVINEFEARQDEFQRLTLEHKKKGKSDINKELLLLVVGGLIGAFAAKFVDRILAKDEKSAPKVLIDDKRAAKQIRMELDTMYLKDTIR